MSKRPILEPYHLALIVPFLIGIGLFVATYICPPDTEAQHVPDEHPRYVLLRGGNTLGTHYSEYPCEIINPLYEAGVYIGSPDAFPQADDRLIDWQEKTVHNIYYRDYGTVLYVWRDFTLGPDGHPHPRGGYLVECDL